MKILIFLQPIKIAVESIGGARDTASAFARDDLKRNFEISVGEKLILKRNFSENNKFRYKLITN